MRVLYLFTEYFPFGDTSMSEHAFLQNEIPYLAEKFDKVVLIPTLLLGATYTSNLPIDIDISLGKILKKVSKIKIFMYALTHKYLYLEIVSKPNSMLKLKKLKRLLYFTGKAVLIKKWLKTKIARNYTLYNSIFYTFWFNEVTFGISTVRGTKVISRAHGHDLFQTNDRYIPCYELILKNLVKIYLVSDFAATYLKKEYPDLSNKVSSFPLGVKKALKKSSYSKDETVRIVSCSYLKKNKRVHLIVQGLSIYIRKYRKKVQWTHFGDGQGVEKIKDIANGIPGKCFNYELMGSVSNKTILEYYQKEAVDIFIMCSKEEGGVPVALQEAQAHGIPIIGTKVGGIPEIVNSDVGVLLHENPSPDEIADAINHIVSDKNNFIQMREKSILNWEKNFNENTNYTKFIVDINSLFN